jgi:hypothetical protein
MKQAIACIFVMFLNHVQVIAQQLSPVGETLNHDVLWWEDGIGSDKPYFSSLRTRRFIDVAFDTILPSTSVSKDTNSVHSLHVGAFGTIEGGLSLRKTNPSFSIEHGVKGGYRFKDVIDVTGFFVAQATGLPDWQYKFPDSLGIIPGHGFERPNSIMSYAWGGSVAYRPSNHFLLEAGKGRHFWGDGHRSLLLSDYAPEYPYAMITTDIWRIRYISLYGFMQDRYPQPFIKAKRQSKYITAHYFSMNLGNRFEVSLFETIIWQGKDTMLNRGYDVHYLNPIIFFRPVEYSIGSADNAIVGMNLRYTPAKGITLYAQTVFDEFYLKEIRADVKHAFRPEDTTFQYGWWANKYGFQLGLKVKNPFGLTGLRFSVEANTVRPFTYAHGTVPQNYGHANHALAHPLGANFSEGIFKTEYDYKGFTFKSHWIIYKNGLDTAGKNFGGDIFQSYDGAYRYREYGNEIAQGKTQHVLLHRFSVSRVVLPSLGLVAYLEWIYRSNRSFSVYNVSHYISAGVSMPMRRQTRDF